MAKTFDFDTINFTHPGLARRNVIRIAAVVIALLLIFGIEVDLVVALPGVKKDEATTLLEAAHQICPYSNATRNNIEVRSA